MDVTKIKNYFFLKNIVQVRKARSLEDLKEEIAKLKEKDKLLSHKAWNEHLNKNNKS